MSAFRFEPARDSRVVGKPYLTRIVEGLPVIQDLAFLAALLLIALWLVSEPYFHYSDTWQLVVNTATTVVTFLIVFLIQNTQNRDAKAIHLKLDEVIRSINPAHNEMIDIEKLSDEELERLSAEYEQIRKECEARRSEQKSA